MEGYNNRQILQLRILQEYGVQVSSFYLGKAVKTYNNFEMTITDRYIQLINSHPIPKQFIELCKKTNKK